MSSRDFDPSLVKFKPRVLSGRDFDLIEACPATGVFGLREKSKPDFGQWWGIFIGKFLEYAVLYDTDYALEYIESKYPRALNTCAKIDMDEIIALKPEVEPEIAIETATRLVSRIPHKEALPEVHVHSRGDIFFNLATDRPHVADYKSGERVYDPSTMSQMRALAAKVYAEKKQKGEEVVAVDVSIINVVSTGELRWTTRMLTADELEAYLRHMRRVHLSVLMSRQAYDEDGDRPDRRPGKHCRWCQLKLVCPDADPEALKPEKKPSKRGTK